MQRTRNVLIDCFACTFICFLLVCLEELSTQAPSYNCGMYFPLAYIRLAFNSYMPTTTAHSLSGCVRQLMRQTSIVIIHTHTHKHRRACLKRMDMCIYDRILICTQSINRAQSVSERIPFHRIDIVHSTTTNTNTHTHSLWRW